MTIYVVTYIMHEETIEGVFSTEEKAKDFINRKSYGWDNPWYIQEFELDEQ